jgi:hypothetical protein
MIKRHRRRQPLDRVTSSSEKRTLDMVVERADPSRLLS